FPWPCSPMPQRPHRATSPPSTPTGSGRKARSASRASPCRSSAARFECRTSQVLASNPTWSGSWRLTSCTSRSRSAPETTPWPCSIWFRAGGTIPSGQAWADDDLREPPVGSLARSRSCMPHGQRRLAFGHFDKPHVVIQHSMRIVEVPHHNESTSAFDIRHSANRQAPRLSVIFPCFRANARQSRLTRILCKVFIHRKKAITDCIARVDKRQGRANNPCHTTTDDNKTISDGTDPHDKQDHRAYSLQSPPAHRCCGRPGQGSARNARALRQDSSSLRHRPDGT